MYIDKHRVFTILGVAHSTYTTERGHALPLTRFFPHGTKSITYIKLLICGILILVRHEIAGKLLN